MTSKVGRFAKVSVSSLWRIKIVMHFCESSLEMSRRHSAIAYCILSHVKPDQPTNQPKQLSLQASFVSLTDSGTRFHQTMAKFKGILFLNSESLASISVKKNGIRKI